MSIFFYRVCARQAKSVFLKKVEKRQAKSVFLFKHLRISVFLSSNLFKIKFKSELILNKDLLIKDKLSKYF